MAQEIIFKSRGFYKDGNPKFEVILFLGQRQYLWRLAVYIRSTAVGTKLCSILGFVARITTQDGRAAWVSSDHSFHFWYHTAYATVALL